MMGGLILLLVILFAMNQLPYKYNPVYYIENVWFIEALPENPLLAETAFGEIGIRYREDVVRGGVIFVGELFNGDDHEPGLGKILPITNLIDTKTFEKLDIDDGSSVATYYQDKNYDYHVVDMSDGIWLYINERKR